MIVGPPDIGKSTLCAYIMNQLLNRRIRPVVIDADVGQADIGPPTVIASATPDATASTLTELKPNRMVFVGCTSPSTAESRIISGIKQLVNYHSGPLSIINTDGWLLDLDAVRYKCRMISEIKPDVVIGIGSKSELQSVMNLTKSKWILVDPSNALLPRSRSARKEHRSYGYRRFLEGSTSHTIPTSLLKQATAMSPLLTSNSVNRITGLMDEQGYLRHIGVLTRYSEDTLRIFTQSLHGITSVELGTVKLSRDGFEL